MQLPTDHTVHPHLVPIAEWLRRQNVNAVLHAGVLGIAASAFGLDSSTEHLDSAGFRLGGSDVAAVRIVTDSERCQ